MPSGEGPLAVPVEAGRRVGRYEIGQSAAALRRVGGERRVATVDAQYDEDEPRHAQSDLHLATPPESICRLRHTRSPRHMRTVSRIVWWITIFDIRPNGSSGSRRLASQRLECAEPGPSLGALAAFVAASRRQDHRSGFIQPERVEPDHVVDAEIIF